MNRLLALSCLLLLATTRLATAQAWTKVYGGPGFEYGYNLYTMPDGGFISAGTRTPSASSSDEQFWVARFDSNGSKLWDSSYGTGVAKTLFGSGQTRDAGLMFGGFTDQQFSGREAAIMYRIDSSGRSQWQFSLDYASSDHFHFMVERKEGGYFFGGHTDSKTDPNGNMWLVKLDNARNVIWEKEYDNGSGEHAHWGAETPDGGAILLGHTSVSGYEKFWLVKVDSNGTRQWAKVFSSSPTVHDSPYHVFVTAEGNYALVGGSQTATQPTTGTSWLVVVDPSGTTLVDKHYGNPAGSTFTWSGRQTSDGGYVLSGYTTYGSNGGPDMYVVKTSATGIVQWEKKFGGTGGDYAYDVVETPSGYVAVGYTGSGTLMTGGGGDLILMKIAKEAPPVAPVAPSLISPANTSSDVGPTPTMTWSQPSGATLYHLQVASDSLFGSKIVDDSTLTTASLRTPKLQPGQRYWWRVRAANGGGTSPWSPTWTFTTLALPAQIVLVSPAEGAVLPDTIGRFVWQPGSPSITRYTIEIATDSLFSSKYSNSPTDTVLTYASLVRGGTYWWRVRASNAAGTGPYSLARKFSVSSTSRVADDLVTHGIVLEQNVPNPVTASTTIRFLLPRQSRVSLDVIDMRGTVVGHLVDDVRSQGWHSTQFDGTTVPVGNYVVRLALYGSDGITSVQDIRMTIVR